MTQGWRITLSLDARQDPYDGRAHRLSCEAVLPHMHDERFLILALKVMEDFRRLVELESQATK